MISYTYEKILKPQLFKREPEDVHDRFLKFGHFLGSNGVTRTITASILNYSDPILNNKVDGVKYNNPIGLSAGFDKDGYLHNILSKVGFGFMQVGSVTYRPYEGNPKPRLHRLPKSKGLVVYYGLKNDGVKEIVKRLKKRKDIQFPLSISVAKTNCDLTSTTEGGIEDYILSLKYLEKNRVGDLYTINISCPNTFGGEPFTSPEKLRLLFAEIDKLNIKNPIYVKMPINLSFDEFDALVDVLISYGVNGVVIGNLNKERTPELIHDDIPEGMNGGISGFPTKELSNRLIAHTYQKYGTKITIVGVGGVFSADDAYEKIKLGATLVQLITGMIYQGPQLIGEINKGIALKLREDGFKSINEAIGSDVNY